MIDEEMLVWVEDDGEAAFPADVEEQHLLRAAGYTYDLFWTAFGIDSYDNQVRPSKRVELCRVAVTRALTCCPQFEIMHHLFLCTFPLGIGNDFRLYEDFFLFFSALLCRNEKGLCCGRLYSCPQASLALPPPPFLLDLPFVTARQTTTREFGARTRSGTVNTLAPAPASHRSRPPATSGCG